MRISDWSSDVCSSDLPSPHRLHLAVAHAGQIGTHDIGGRLQHPLLGRQGLHVEADTPWPSALGIDRDRRVHAADLGTERCNSFANDIRRAGSEHEMHGGLGDGIDARSEEHTSELQSLLRNSYAVFCLKK